VTMPRYDAARRRLPSSGHRREFSVPCCRQAGDVLRTWSRVAS
jgi:hypothetical protein